MDHHAITPAPTSLLPTSKSDESSIALLSTLDPSQWVHLILLIPQTSTHTPVIDASDGLLMWLQDMNWPIALPTARLLLTLVNEGQEKRDMYGHVLVSNLKQLFAETEDWDWVFWTAVHVVGGVEDKAWIRRELGESLGRFKSRVPEDVESDWGFKGVIGEILDEGDNEREEMLEGGETKSQC